MDIRGVLQVKGGLARRPPRIQPGIPDALRLDRDPAVWGTEWGLVGAEASKVR